jgi:hypothetical protein
MGNEEFLILSYIIVAAITTCLGFVAWMWLRSPLGSIVEQLPRKGWAAALKRSYPATTILAALGGFLSVSYYGCPRESYKNMISNRAHIIAVSGQQVSESFYSIVLAVFFWGVVILMSLVAIQRARQRTKGSD